MKPLNIPRRDGITFLSFLFLILYILLPSKNNTIDAWGFASYVKQNENLFLSHHLLYNALGFLWVRLCGLFLNLDTLRLLIVQNSIFAALTLYLLGITLKKIGIVGKRLVLWILFVGSSWGFMRYATENETYIIPIFFSMLASYFYIKGTNKQNPNSFFYSGLSSAVACLFHQIMVFWWFSLLLGTIFRRDKKEILLFSLPALLVPLGYLLVLKFYYSQNLSIESILHFTLRDYYTGAAGIAIGFGSFLLTAISLIRTFLQIHGYFLFLQNISMIFILCGLASIVLIIIGLYGLKRIKWFLENVKGHVVWVHLLAFILQIIFAFASSGNAEFMVMIPILLAIILSQIIQNEEWLVGFISSGMLIWNISLGLYPISQHSLDYNRNISERVLESNASRENHLFILYNKPNVENRVKYITGRYPTNVISGIEYDSISQIEKRISVALNENTVVYTDCVSRPKTISRETFVISDDYVQVFNKFYLSKVDSAETLTGKYYLYSVSRKK